MNSDSIGKFKEELAEIYHLQSALAVLRWDEDVYMPPKGSDIRGKTIASLAGMLHDRFVSPQFSRLVRSAKKELDAGRLDEDNACIVREVWREFSREKKLPTEFVKELAETTSKSVAAWKVAREKKDFKRFAPVLRKVVELERRQAEYLGYKSSPYEALLDIYEPGASLEDLEMTFFELRDFLVPFLGRIMGSKVRIKGLPKKDYPLAAQEEFNRFVAARMGFDFEAGRLDVSVHPFTTNFHSYDVRITTRYDRRDPLSSINSTIHEAGHALYEQGIPNGNFGSPLGEAVSLGIHESQSRLWENIVGRSLDFWKYFYPRLRKRFPGNLDGFSLEDFHRHVNAVKPSLIRTEADEVTYSLHIILRFEIEKGLIEGSLAVEDLPKIWRAKMKEYFGIAVPNDALGVLQDVHWPSGLFGYFPTYALGNLYGAQFYAAAKRDILGLEKEMRSGNLSHLREWLRKNVHAHGKRFLADELIRRTSGEPLNARYFMDYLKEKYSRIYGL